MSSISKVWERLQGVETDLALSPCPAVMEFMGLGLGPSGESVEVGQLLRPLGGAGGVAGVGGDFVPRGVEAMKAFGAVVKVARVHAPGLCQGGRGFSQEGLGLGETSVAGGGIQ
jgi:hypothetical protein